MSGRSVDKKLGLAYRLGVKQNLRHLFDNRQGRVVYFLAGKVNY